MRRYENKKKRIFNNVGSTLITVIVAIGFVTILTTIILGASLNNIRMKAIDRRAKDDFYYTEKALNDIYTGLGQQVSVIAANAYDAAFASVGLDKLKDDEGNLTIDIATAQKAEIYYKKKFFSDVKSWLDTNANPVEFQKYVVDTSAAGKEAYVMGAGKYPVIVEDNNENPVDDPDHYADNAVSIRIKDVNVVCADTSKDYKGEVITDIVITVPKLSFFDENADVVDYAIIANKGIEINGDLEVKDGNVYAGLEKVDETTSDGGIKINSGEMIFDGNYLVSKGDIIVGSTTPASITVGHNRVVRPNIWFNSIITSPNATNSKVDMEANMFVLNDMILNGNESEVTISGAYYGYDDGARPSLVDQGKAHSDSSAIIINGNGCKLDMNGVSTLMLMGKAYVETGAHEIATAEGLALRTNQQLYLVPPDFLECANPTVGAITNVDDWGCDIPNTWFGYKYLKKQADGITPEITSFVVGEGSDAISYAFLEFDDTLGPFNNVDIGGTANMRARSSFVYEIIHGNDPLRSTTPPTQNQLRTRITNSLANFDNFKLQDCIIDNSHSANVFSMNALARYGLDYNDITSSNRIGNATLGFVDNTVAFDRYSSYPQNLFYRYQWLCTMLKPNEDIPLHKEISQVTYGGTRGVNAIDEDSPWKADSDYPYKYYVKTPDTSITGTADTTKIPSSSYGNFIYYTAGTYDIPNNSTFRGVVISTGDINVGSGADINGILIAKGKITFGGNNKVKSDRALLQKRIAKEVELAKVDGKYCTDYLISYLDDGTGHLLYGNIAVEGAAKRMDDSRTDYTEYIYYENWQKGGR